MKGLLSLCVLIGLGSVLAGAGAFTGMAIAEKVQDKMYASECKRRIEEIAKKQTEALKNDETEIES